MDDTLKQRLVGATILVVLAVIFLPFILDGGGMVKPTEPLSLDLPDASSENTVTITLKPSTSVSEVVADSQIALKPTYTPRPAVTPPSQPISQSGKAVDSPKPSSQSEKPVSKPKLVQRQQPVRNQLTAPVDTQSGQWVVQLGSFSQRSNAQALRDQLINKGYQSFVEASGQGSRKVFRVRVGPLASRDGAETIRKKLKQNEKRDALVMAYP